MGSQPCANEAVQPQHSTLSKWALVWDVHGSCAANRVLYRRCQRVACSQGVGCVMDLRMRRRHGPFPKLIMTSLLRFVVTLPLAAHRRYRHHPCSALGSHAFSGSMTQRNDYHDTSPPPRFSCILSHGLLENVWNGFEVGFESAGAVCRVRRKSPSGLSGLVLHHSGVLWVPLAIQCWH
jgi:hypothetical protein